jgi:hypothetical protein
VHLERRARKPHAARECLVYPTLRDPIAHERVQPECGWDGRALKVLGLAGRVLGDRGYCYVEAGETCQPAENEEGEAEVVEGGADADCEGDGRGGDAERDLFFGKV